MTLGLPRLHLRSVGSTNDRARALAERGAPHGTLVSADEQTAGRGRHGRDWVTPPGVAIAASLVLREWDALLSLRAGLAVADVAGPEAQVKWPNDVWLSGRKVAGILVETRNGSGWAVLGIGVNVALDPATLPPEVAGVAGTLGRPRDAVEPALLELLRALERRLAQDPASVVADLRERDALRGRRVVHAGGEGVAAGIDESGALLVEAGGRTDAITTGEVRPAAPT
jgi:BirA family transcriptional regulator, biotin operon repressor / biotin---[acetyl-CoA-carboxylase] ligase